VEFGLTNKKNDKLNQVVIDARRASDEREQGYRARALKMYPHLCGRCGREFSGKNLHELTVHHRDHNHDNNPVDGSNWELLCLYCHDNEHQRQVEAQSSLGAKDESARATFSPFADLEAMLDEKKKH
jgi:5-methylcytosine-specific restriction endonuclease McrA